MADATFIQSGNGSVHRTARTTDASVPENMKSKLSLREMGRRFPSVTHCYDGLGNRCRSNTDCTIPPNCTYQSIHPVWARKPSKGSGANRVCRCRPPAREVPLGRQRLSDSMASRCGRWSPRHDRRDQSTVTFETNSRRRQMGRAKTKNQTVPKSSFRRSHLTPATIHYRLATPANSRTHPLGTAKQSSIIARLGLSNAVRY